VTRRRPLWTPTKIKDKLSATIDTYLRRHSI
jgi:hypothetical protein